MESDRLEILKLIAKELKARNICLCDDYKSWYKFGNACASFGESGREAFHLFSSTSRYYHVPGGARECDNQFNACLRSCNVRDGVDYLIKTLVPFNVLNVSEVVRNSGITAQYSKQTPQRKPTQTPQRKPTPRRGYKVLY